METIMIFEQVRAVSPMAAAVGAPTSEGFGCVFTESFSLQPVLTRQASSDFMAHFVRQKEPAEKITKKNTPEQQALAKYDLDYVTDKYLPEKLTELGVPQ